MLLEIFDLAGNCSGRYDDRPDEPECDHRRGQMLADVGGPATFPRRNGRWL
ncbi:hypothetical protein ACQEVC_35535 [Plantactinospora sp. CA-294935]|uniref:hypothetical protein n=1 Tax=Plantactinospora sp. CA-294935 TaxID=3240012 RepID=UPI003D8D63B9